MTMQLNHAIAADEHRETLTDAVAAAHLARRRAERELRRSELERDQTARALELNLHPLDEHQREHLRVAYADAAASVAVHRDAFERAVEVEHATEVLARAFDPRESVLVPRETDGRPLTRQGNVLRFSGRSRSPSPDVRAPLR
jgi:putative alpha-1,2-mannosidase